MARIKRIEQLELANFKAGDVLINIKAFIKGVKSKEYTDKGGVPYFANSHGYEQIDRWIEDIIKNNYKIPVWVTHVIWDEFD